MVTIDPLVQYPGSMASAADTVDKQSNNNPNSPANRIRIPICDWCDTEILADRHSRICFWSQFDTWKLDVNWKWRQTLPLWMREICRWAPIAMDRCFSMNYGHRSAWNTLWPWQLLAAAILIVRPALGSHSQRIWTVFGILLRLALANHVAVHAQDLVCPVSTAGGANCAKNGRPSFVRIQKTISKRVWEMISKIRVTNWP